jgi:hypothetical protein
VTAQAQAGMATDQALQTEQLRRALFHQKQAPPQQVTYLTLRFGVDVAGWQDIQSEQVRHKACIGFIVGVFKAVVLLDDKGVGQRCTG